MGEVSIAWRQCNLLGLVRVVTVLLLLSGWVAAAFGNDTTPFDAATTSTPINFGYRDFNYGTSVYPRPTEARPQSKLWWNDGFWWGCLWDDAQDAYRIQQLDVPTQSWVSVGPNAAVDPSSVVDVKCDGTLLYILSHPFNASGAFTLHSYTYDTLSNSYALRSGFPVVPNSGSAEAVTLDKDTTGKLWICWEEGRDIMINTSQGDDTSWGTPFVLPAQAELVAVDDISALVAFNGMIGVMWSDQSNQMIYFATHNDGDPDGTWQALENVVGGPGEGAIADDHLNFAVTSDPSANIYAVSKTSLDSTGEPQILLLHRTAPGTWDSYEVGVFEDEHTRPIILIDEDNRVIYVFAMSLFGPNSIRVKMSDLDNISFTSGPGQLFIQGDDELSVNNPTSTKQTLNGQTDLVVLASDGADRVYMHNFLDLAAVSGPDIDVDPASHDYGDVLIGHTSTQTLWVHNVGIDSLHVSGSSLGGPNASAFSITTGDSAFSLAPADSQSIDVRFLPISIGAKSATLSIASNDPNESPFVVALAGNGTVPVEPDIAVSPALLDWGQVLVDNTVSQSIGVRNDGTANLDVIATMITGADAALFTITSGGGAFSVAPGDTLDITVEFAPTSLGAKIATLEITSNDPDEPTLNVLLLGESVESILGGGAVVFEDVVTGVATDAVSIATSIDPPAVANDLYLAAVTSKSLQDVANVSGMGMTWTLVAKQCGGRGQTGVEVWMARSASPTSGPVTATFVQQTNAAVIAVSRYSGVHSTTPLGTPVTASTIGISAPCDDTGTDTASYSVPITAIANPGLVYGAIARRSSEHTPDPDWTERAEAQAGSGGNTAGLACVDSTVAAGSVTLSGSFSGTVDWAVVAVEILPAPSTTTDVRPDVMPDDRAVLEVRAGDRGPVIALVSPDWTHLRLTVHDVRGRLVETLWNGQAPPGPLQFTWQPEGPSVAAGIYFVRAKMPRRLLTSKLVLVR